MKRVCVYCGSNFGVRPEYAEVARELGLALVEAGLALVYGGASVGLMGLLSTTVREAGGEVIGVMPRSLVEKEIADPGLTDLRIVDSMHERKALMAELADGFVALPGGFGTLDEFFEVLTWAQLGLHSKPCALLDVVGYYEALLTFLDHAAGEELVRPQHRAMLLHGEDPRDLLRLMSAYEPPTGGKWFNRSLS